MSMPETQTLEALHYFIYRYYRTNAPQSLQQLYELDTRVVTVEDDLVVFVKNERSAILNIVQFDLEAHPDQEQVLLPVFLVTTQKWLYQHNQFVNLSDSWRVRLAKIYIELLLDIKNIVSVERDNLQIKRLYELALKKHRLNIATFSRSLNERYEYASRPAVCHYYTPALQLAVLGLELDGALVQPVLDLGCGEQGQFVEYLRLQGIEAFGLDRLVRPSSYLKEGDWLDFDFQAGVWGTVISHMAFSNHFIFHHLYKKGVPHLYATRFIQILRRLKPGGSFYYAPGLPFIEPILPTADFFVRKKVLNFAELPARFMASDSTEGTALLGTSQFYATRITKIAECSDMLKRNERDCFQP